MEKDVDVDCIMINMYCGQLPADKVAVVIREAFEKNYCTKPIVCRIKGNMAADANQILRDLKSDKVVVIDDLDQAAMKVIELGK